MQRSIAVAALFAALCVAVATTGVHAGSTLVVNSPPELALAFTRLYPGVGDIPDAPAMFGIPFYGQSNTGVVVPAIGQYGCEAIDTSNFPDPALGYLTILMIDRGGANCTFVRKVRNCQAAGAVACIIADSQTSPFARLPIMGDDGTANAQLITPSVIISNRDAGLIKQNISAGVQVMMTITFSLPNPDGHVEWQLWTSSNDPPSHSFKHEFLPAALQLGDSHSFTPHYDIKDGSWYGCLSGGCGRQCTNGGRYCAVDPEFDQRYGVDGEDVVMENLRQMCVFQYLNQTNQIIKWWHYVNIFADTCGRSDATWNATCSDSILTTLQIPAATIAACVANSGGFTNNENTLLEAEMDLRLVAYIFHIPQLVINNEYYWGSMTCPEPLQLQTCGVLQALCSAFLPGTAPQACNGDAGCAIGVKRDVCNVCGGDGQIDACGLCLSPKLPAFNTSCAGCDGVPNSNFTRDACGRCLKRSDVSWIADSTLCVAAAPDSPSSGVSLGIVVVVSVVGLTVLGGAVFFFVRRSKQRMQQDVTNLLRQYVPLDADAKTVERYRADKQQPLSHQSENIATPIDGSLNAASVAPVPQSAKQQKAVEKASLLTDPETAAGVAGPAPVDEL